MKRNASCLTALTVVLSLIVGACSSDGPINSLIPTVSDSCVVPHSKPGPASDSVEFSQQGVDQAAASVRNGTIDFYQAGLKLSAADQIKNDPRVKSYRAPAGSIDLLLNPAPDPSGLNPFSLLKVRQAMQYLVDRDYYVNSIYGGNAKVQVAPISQLDWDYQTITDVITQSGIRHDTDLALRMINEAMQGAGATMVNGKWNYNGQPIRIKFIIRTEDERKIVGDAVRDSLEKAGFEVITQYQEFAAAISTVQTSDPQVFDWHIYTEGWGRGSANRYDFASINQFAAPWMGNMPGWLIPNYWQYENPVLDEVGQKVFMGDFSSRQERDDLYRQATGMALDESVRIWLATTTSVFPASPNLNCVTEDVVSGPKSLLTLRDAYIPGKDTLRVGHFWVWTASSVWNPVGGFGDVFSTDIWKNIYDPSLINDPSSGEPIPFRASFQVETAGSSGSKLAVPSEAIKWDADSDRWEPVPQGTQATSKVVFDLSKYFQSVWHNQRPITMADVLYNLAATFDRVYDPDKSRVEFVLSVTQKPLLDRFQGFRVLDDNRIEVYLDYWHFDEAYIASYADVIPLAFPWEIMAASDELVYGLKQAAYSQASAARYNVPWLSLAESRGAGLVARVLRGFSRNSYVPKGYFAVNGKTYVSVQDALVRYSATLAWFDQYNHLIISNGPFILARYDPPAQYAELKAFRDPTYPFKPGDWYRPKP
ncbi:hypothetical protein A2797_01865 [candidate division WWE3 bacterium RIFCSPHIGHO2_01_FULL_48_15]|uniref:Solute-binding protein family 5 domain-containing protein n=1 Tax=candidate division WWE3 bacterium RIFCSPHIGHO2_01_FULL_48_15 TaxID=1802619 RepID=A0A1F4VFV9_UNCKA|nr:MAG: hypothetical protein A2797_01865 [candidate division WWE3 bacterium RIFCSPHIGHO2_01_FULL_48_15]